MRPEDTELASGTDSLDACDGMYLSFEHGYVCVRDEHGWLLWSAEGDAMPFKGQSLRSVIMDAVKNQHVRMPRNPRTE